MVQKSVKYELAFPFYNLFSHLRPYCLVSFNKISSSQDNEKKHSFMFFFSPRINRFIPRVQENYLKLGARALIIISTSKLSLFSFGIIYVNRLQTISTRSVKIQMIYRWAVTQLPNCFHLLLTTVYFHSPFLWLLTKERKKSKEKKPIQFLLSIVTQ